MADKKISELDQTLNLSDQADFPLSQDNGGEPTTFRAKLTQIATKIAEAITFSNLKTGNKQLVSAVNQTISNLADDFNTTAGSTYAKDDCVLYNGVLYQCNNSSGTTSGTFIDADWTAIKAVDVGSGGGGGSGGHTILDDSGTALTQRSSMQFKGAYSEDNSTDDVTEVNVIRNMTKAEFDLLTDDEKKGIINITDITSGSDDRFQPVIRSLEEREIGVWTDGKPLYEKTLNLNVTNSGDIFDISNLHIDTMIQVAGFIHQTGGNNPSVPYSSSPNDYALPYYSFSDDSIHVIFAGSYNQTTWVITVRYTKTTDTAGSGQWTPQGVPAHHYSTSEQIVGTWVDGSTLYEKTFELPSRTSVKNDYSTIIISDTTTYAINSISDCVYYDNNGGSDLSVIRALPTNIETYLSANNTLIAYYNTNDVYKITKFTLRYTKSSS